MPAAARSEGSADAPRALRRAALLAAFALALAGIPAGWLDVRANPSYTLAYEERLQLVQALRAALAALAAGAAWRAGGRGAARALLLVWCVAAGVSAAWIRSPAVSLAAALELALVALLLAGGPRALALALGLAAAGAALLGAEAFVSQVALERVPDYGDLATAPSAGPFVAGGQLRPGLDLEVRGDGPGGRVRFVTDAFGFRNRTGPAPGPPPPGTRRIVLAGDSFVAGYRVDQDDALGALLEHGLRERGRPALEERIEVLVARLDNPALAWLWLQRHGARWAPDVVVLGVTLGNDPAECWLALHPAGGFRLRSDGGGERILPADRWPAVGFTVPPLADELLPRDAHRSRPGGALGAAADAARALGAKWADLALLRGALGPGPDEPGIGSWYGDGPGRVHAFDLVHGLGAYYARGPLAHVEEAFARLERCLAGTAATCAELGAELVVLAVPQRFEVADREWEAAVRRYRLDPAAFDREAPRRRLAAACERLGVALVDPTERLAAADAEGGLPYLPRGDMHWSRAGHRAAAEALLQSLNAAGR